MDTLYLSQRILITSDTFKDMVSGGILVSCEDGRIKRIFTSQLEINSWMFVDHGGEVRNIFKPGKLTLFVDLFDSLDSGP